MYGKLIKYQSQYIGVRGKSFFGKGDKTEDLCYKWTCWVFRKYFK